MTHFFTTHGLTGLFFASLLASTIIPFGSEWLLIALISQGLDLNLTVATATAGNFLGACITYWLGFTGSSYFIEKIFKIRPESIARAHTFFDRYGSWSLLFSWLPIVGDPLCLVSGTLRFSFGRFSVLVLTGKWARYLSVALITKGLV
nr:DedA family protein [Desulfobulbaceae bacterium]